jgi:hypothetical protein
MTKSLLSKAADVGHAYQRARLLDDAAVNDDFQKLMHEARAALLAARRAIWPARITAAAIERQIQKLPRKIFCIAPGLGDACDCRIEYRK